MQATTTFMGSATSAHEFVNADGTVDPDGDGGQSTQAEATVRGAVTAWASDSDGSDDVDL